MLGSTLISAPPELEPLTEDPLLSTVFTFFTTLVKPCLFAALSEPSGADELISGWSDVDAESNNLETFGAC